MTKKRREERPEESEISEDTVVFLTEEVSLDEDSNFVSSEEIKFIDSDEDFNHRIVYKNKNNCMLDEKDEIIATQN